MLWYLTLGVAVAVALILALSASSRRIVGFALAVTRTALLWLGDQVGLWRLWCALTRRRYRALTGPYLARRLCEDMGTTFIKFGQIVASSAGIFPDRYVAEFQKCLDRVRPFGFDEVMAIVAEELGQETLDELGEIEPEPLASASIAQVHNARLGDGKAVVIKVQRPGIEARIATDVGIMRFTARVATRLIPQAQFANPVGIVDDFAATLVEELDFRQEAHNLERFNAIMAEVGESRVRAPVPQWAYSSRRVLVMERFFGVRVDNVAAIQSRAVDAEALLITGMRAWFKCVVHHGFFHGDVHAGNLMLLDDDGIGFLDFGIVGRLDDEERRLVTDYMIAFATGDYRQLAALIALMGGASGRDAEGAGAGGAGAIDMDAFIADLERTAAPLRTMSFGDIQYSRILPEIQRVASRYHLVMPRAFVLITKQLLYFDRYAKLLAPKLNVFTDPRLIMAMMSEIQRARAGFDRQAPEASEAAEATAAAEVAPAPERSSSESPSGSDSAPDGKDSTPR